MSDSSAPALSDSARAVLGVLAATGEVTRPVISRRLNVSKPTVSLAISELESAGLVVSKGSAKGSLGRAASIYGVGPGAGWTLGLDLGASRLELLARALDGRLLCRRTHSEADASTLRELAAQVVDEVRRDFSSMPLRAAGIAVPRIVPEPGAEAVTDPWLPGATLRDLVATLSLPVDVPVLVENNVNCAALAEMSLGAARGSENFVYLQIGLRIGAGIMLNGRLIRGAYGAAGEVSRIPFPFTPGGNAEPEFLEAHLGSNNVLAEARNRWSSQSAPGSTPELFQLASAGDDTALDVVRRYAHDVGNLALAISAVIDPEMIVLGGGVGQNPIFAPMVLSHLLDRGSSVDVRTSELGEHGTVEGAIAIATDHAMNSLLGSHHASRLDGRAAAIVLGAEGHTPA